jgi:hypothetical protein
VGGLILICRNTYFADVFFVTISLFDLDDHLMQIVILLIELINSRYNTALTHNHFPLYYIKYTTLSKKYPTLGQEKKVAYLGGLNS